MSHYLGKVVRSRPKTTVLVLTLLAAAGIGAGLYAYALHQWNMAQSALKDDRLAEARSQLAFCLTVWPRSAPVHLLAARAARLSGDFAGADAHLKECKNLLEGTTEDIQLEYLLMRVQKGEVEEVAPLLLLYIEKKHPESALILETLAGAYLHNLRYGPALAYLHRWIQAAPDTARAYQMRGWVLERVNDNAGAVGDYKRALELNPDLVVVRLRLVEVFLEKSNPLDALPHLERLMEQFPDRADVLARMGQCRYLQGQPAEARRLLEAAAEELPNDAPLLITLAKLDLQEDRPIEAERWLRRALKADPTDAEAQYKLVESLRKQGRHEEAAAALGQFERESALLRRANKLLLEEGENPNVDPEGLYEVGVVYLRGGQERLGVYWLRKVLDRNPNHQATLTALAEHYEKKGDKEQAANYRRRIVER